YCHDLVITDGAGHEVGRTPSILNPTPSTMSPTCALNLPVMASNANWSYTHTFASAGTYTYYCEIHSSTGSYGNRQGMVGTVTVAAGSNGQTTSTTGSTGGGSSGYGSGGSSAGSGSGSGSSSGSGS